MFPLALLGFEVCIFHVDASMTCRFVILNFRKFFGGATVIR